MRGVGARGIARGHGPVRGPRRIAALVALARPDPPRDAQRATGRIRRHRRAGVQSRFGAQSARLRNSHRTIREPAGLGMAARARAQHAIRRRSRALPPAVRKALLRRAGRARRIRRSSARRSDSAAGGPRCGACRARHRRGRRSRRAVAGQPARRGIAALPRFRGDRALARGPARQRGIRRADGERGRPGDLRADGRRDRAGRRR